MTPEMQQALVALSTFYHADPAAVFRRVLETIAAHYGGTTAMINLIEEDRLRYREAINLHPVLAHLHSVALSDAY